MSVILLTSVSDCPTPTVSTTTTSYPAPAPRHTRKIVVEILGKEEVKEKFMYTSQRVAKEERQ